MTNPGQIEQSNEESIHIRYSVFNFRSEFGPNSFTERFAYSRDTPEGNFYSYHPNVPSEIKSIFRSAVVKWCSETSIAWRINQNNSPDAVDISGVDQVNIVKMKPSSFFENPIARAAVIITGHYSGCGTGSIGSLNIRDTDIVIRDDFNPFDPNYAEYKWYNRILHELGHAHGLNHSKNPSISSTEEYLLNSNTNNISSSFHDVQDDDKEGAESCFDASEELLSISGCDDILPIITHDCNSLNALEEIKTLASILIFPNPVINELSIQLDSERSEDVTLVVQNIYGQTLLEEKWHNNAGDNQKNIPLFSINKGSYILLLQADKKIESFKL